jgi:glycerol uptake facilitator-like aquaporin
MAEPPHLPVRATAEAVGTAFLLAAVVGSGIAASRLFPDQPGLALLANSLASGAALAALILAFGPISGAHFNPLVSLADVAAGHRPLGEAAVYAAAQLAGAVGGVAAAHAMFGEALFTISRRARPGLALVFAELVATAGLLLVCFGSSRRGGSPAVAVGLYIGAGYWFTSSTAFANPAVTIARGLTDSFTGIRPSDVPGFLAAQAAGAALAAAFLRWSQPPARRAEEEA